jgi:hypothetical protein
VDKPFLSPLNYQVRIADAQGRPTPEFQQKWRKLFQIAQTIPDVSSAAAMSLLLDKIASDEGDILRRGALAWAGLSTPGGTTKFLRADGTYAEPPQQTVDESEIDLSDVLTNNVSSARHGFAPKLPNDATKYLDGTGQYSVPAGGGGGGLGAWQQPCTSAYSGSGHATKGQIYTPLVNMQLSYLWANASLVVGASYKLSVFETDGSTLGTLIAETAVFVAASNGGQDIIKPLPSTASLTAGQKYYQCLTRTDGTPTTALGTATAGLAGITVPLSSAYSFASVDSIAPGETDSLVAVTSGFFVIGGLYAS